MYESEIEYLQKKITSFENSLNDVLLAEYYRIRRSTDASLEDFLKNSEDVDELQENRFENYTKLDKISKRFWLFSLAIFILSISLPVYSYATLIIYIFIVSIFSKMYFDICNKDAMQVGNLVLCQMEIQRIKRDLRTHGISDAELIRYKSYKDSGKASQSNEFSNTKNNQFYWIELRIVQQICDGLKSQS